MSLKPQKGLKVKVSAKREAVFGEESVSVKGASFPSDKARGGTMTGITLAGFCEVEMPALDGKKHWYPVGDLRTEKGEPIVEDVIEVDVPEDDDEEG
jgi:hypothetical protein